MSLNTRKSLRAAGLPQFPAFVPVSEIRATDLASAIGGHLPYSEFNYVSLRSFYPEAEVSALGNGVAIIRNEFNCAIGSLSALVTERGNSMQGVIEDLYCYANALNLDPILRQVPECSLTNPPKSLQISERRDGFDYIIDITAMMYPTTPELLQKHKRKREYVTEHPDVVVREVGLDDAGVHAILLDIDRAWQEGFTGNCRDEWNGTRAWEQRAFMRCLQHHDALNLTVLLAITSSGNPLGFTINENLGNGYYMAHFGKTLPGQTGLSELLELETARLMQARDCQWMNFGEDLGHPSLRRMKQSWKPHRMLRVYDVGPAG